MQSFSLFFSMQGTRKAMREEGRGFYYSPAENVSHSALNVKEQIGVWEVITSFLSLVLQAMFLDDPSPFVSLVDNSCELILYLNTELHLHTGRNN